MTISQDVSNSVVAWCPPVNLEPIPLEVYSFAHDVVAGKISFPDTIATVKIYGAGSEFKGRFVVGELKTNENPAPRTRATLAVAHLVHKLSTADQNEDCSVEVVDAHGLLCTIRASYVSGWGWAINMSDT